MLILTRRSGETIYIGKDEPITVTILSIRGNQVRIGINAPNNVPVHREEVYKRIKKDSGEDAEYSTENQDEKSFSEDTSTEMEEVTNYQDK